MKAIALAIRMVAGMVADRDACHSPRNYRWTHEQVRRLRWLLWIVLAGVALYVLIAHPAWAADGTVGGKTASFELFDALEGDAETQSNEWFKTIVELVRPTFLLLATLEICWAAAIWAFEKDNLNSLAVEIIKKFMFIGFFYALLQYASEWIPTIAGTFQHVGEAATKTKGITTDRIIAMGLATIDLLWSDAPTDLFGIIGALGKIIVACFVTIGIIIAFVVVAAQYFTLKIESYILFAAGAIFLGLGSSSWTKDYVSKYLNYAINVGVRILVLILILSLTLGAVEKMGDSYKFDYPELLKLLAISILQALLAIKAPEMAGALLNGGVGMSAGSAMGAAASSFKSMKMTAGAATAATGMAAGALKSATSTGISAAQGMGNMGKAVSAGRNMARQEGKSGAAATLSGLGKAAGQAGREVAGAARKVPGKVLDAIKGKTEHGANPGLLDRTKQNLQARAAGGGSGGAGNSKGASSDQVPAEPLDKPAAAGAGPSSPPTPGSAAAPKPADSPRPPALKKGSTTAPQRPRQPENNI